MSLQVAPKDLLIDCATQTEKCNQKDRGNSPLTELHKRTDSTDTVFENVVAVSPVCLTQFLGVYVRLEGLLKDYIRLEIIWSKVWIISDFNHETAIVRKFV